MRYFRVKNKKGTATYGVKYDRFGSPANNTLPKRGKPKPAICEYRDNLVKRCLDEGLGVPEKVIEFYLTAKVGESIEFCGSTIIVEKIEE